MICPACGSNRVHRSRRKWYEKPMKLIGILPYRCHECQNRFFTTALSTHRPAATEPPGKQRAASRSSHG